MRPKKHETTMLGDLFRARLDQIINMKHELVQLAAKIDWAWIDDEIAPDAANAVLCAVGYNFRRILAWLKAILPSIFHALLAAFIGQPMLNSAS
jgi:hypothetical protein